MAELTVSVVSTDNEVWAGKAKQLIARTTVGQIGILPGHEPLLAILASGEVRLTLPGGEKIVAQAEDGFLSVANNQVTIVARKAGLV